MLGDDKQIEHAGEEALAALDKLLADRPIRVGHDFSAATQRLTTLRDALVARLDGGQPPQSDDEALRHLNTVISVVVSTHYPLGAPKWDHLEAARKTLSTALRMR